MPRASSIAQARADKRAGKSPTTQAGHFVHDEIEAVRKGKHGVRSAKQAIAIGLSEARRAGVDVPPKKGATKAETKSAAAAKAAPQRASSESTAKRSQAALKALKRESTAGASPKALSAQAKSAASKRTATDRSAAAKKAASTKGAAGRSEAARKAARTRAAKKESAR
ncbi:DNA-binding protein [Cupriavidus sp. SK-4]|uniref:DUF6496 domain-containing protein n=1 Tax=Cupriavidus sp. SK-4 TaxID=574750 RepID=UPI00044786F4|nr:DUF6496 domain-containing protein [Cupriavidus sp. SK-4]EYS93944.1 DNA-binding protein [Cupriavidus sp. SK-4]